MQKTLFSGNTVYTPVRSYTRNGLEVISVGTMHLGSRTYYQQLQKIIDSLQSGLYEGTLPSSPSEVPKGKRKFLNQLPLVREFYRLLARILRLDTQELTPGERWKNADMTAAELIKMMPESELEQITGMKIAFLKLKKIYEAIPAQTRDLTEALLRYKTENPDKEAPLCKAVFKNFEEHPVLGKARNQKLFHCLEPKLSGSGSFGITYGAGHFPAIDSFLKIRGLKPGNIEWIPAIEFRNLDLVDCTLALAHEAKRRGLEPKEH